MKQGFTLIESLIALAIVAIVSSFAYSNYIKYVTRARRVEALEALSDCANHMTLQYLAHHHYPNEGNLALETQGGWYRIHVNANDSHFNCIADPNPMQARRDDCGRLAIDEEGQKSAQGDLRACWLEA